MLLRTLTLLLLLGATITCAAETRYVSDALEITMRKGESARHKISAMLKSGTPVEVLKVNKSSGYSRVREPNGKEGYVLTRLLLDEPVARERLAELQEQLQSVESEPARLSSELASVQTEFTGLREQHEETLAAKTELEQELAGIRQIAANAITIANERTELQKQVAALSRHVADLEQENRDLKNNTTQDWFLIGSGVVIAGILIGLLLPNLRLRRQRSSWRSL
ncbi:MAG: TIGR04211 family SH3 domain-containing protein [Pseudomonadota bacterium]